MKISLAGLYLPKESVFNNVKTFSIVIVRQHSSIVDVDIEIDGVRYAGCERITIEEER